MRGRDHSLWPVVVGFVLPSMATMIELGARETSPAQRRGDGFLPGAPPAPTEAPERRRVGGGGGGGMELFRRNDLGTDTCGYISGDASYYPLTCGSGYSCTNSGAFRGCCETGECAQSTQFITTCLDATAPACASGTTVGPNTLCCTSQSENPYCLTYLWSTTASPGAVFTQYNCDQASFSGQYVLAADMPTSASSSRTTTARSKTWAGGVGTSARSSVTVIPGGGDESNRSGRGESNTAVGAIVGGVIGGVAALALIGFLAWFLLHNNKKKRKNTAANDDSQPSTGPATDPPAPMGEQRQLTPPPVYDPHHSYAPATTSPGQGARSNPHDSYRNAPPNATGIYDGRQQPGGDYFKAQDPGQTHSGYETPPPGFYEVPGVNPTTHGE
ncbi:hypothetical protein F4778DRAFT_787044 [Xylariomycetidae sp. FL2044]|nr:hypothetical protein F4778DRAFT_787044 [Xylariomycetidae sp. FL2044]